MDKKLKLVLAIAGTIGFLLYDYSFALAWLIGWTSLFVLAYFRERYYSIILSEETFSVGKYISYIVFVFIVLWIAPIVAFIFPNVINPFVLISTYFIDRFILFVGRAFKKESVYVSK